MYKSKQILFLLFINLALLSGLVYFFSNGIFTFLNFYTHHNESIRMPDISSMSFKEAKEKLISLNLSYEVDDNFYDSTYPPGKILNFAPLAGEFVKKNREVYLQVNGSGLVDLPDIKGKEKSIALNSIFKSDLNLGNFIFIPHETKDKIIEVLFEGKIIKAREKLPYGSKVDLIIGEIQKEKILIPDLRGLEFELASNILKKYNFNQGKIHYNKDYYFDISNEELFSNKAESFDSTFKIYKQFPLPGKIYDPNKSIELWICPFDSKKLEELINFHKETEKKNQEIDQNFESIFKEDEDISVE